MEQFRNVVVFGDGLSDIGTKWTSASGVFARATGLMTVSPSGRFSDCRNWTDFMYEEATGATLVMGGAAATVSASRMHLRFRSASDVSKGAAKFRYANYAEGGACGGIPAWSTAKLAVRTMKEQVRQFRGDWRTLYGGPGPADEPTLCFVWFGANDLYTAGCKPEAMAGVAEKIASKRRHEVAAVVGAKNVRFVFMNLARPEASVRYQLALRAKKDTRADRVMKFLGGGVEKEIRELQRGVDLFNRALRTHTSRNGDVYVDTASAVAPQVVTTLVARLGLLDGPQAKGTSKTFVGADAMDARERENQSRLTHVATSDEAHPTDKVYQYIWATIRAKLTEEGYGFGRLNASAVPSRGAGLPGGSAVAERASAADRTAHAPPTHRPRHCRVDARTPPLVRFAAAGSRGAGRSGRGASGAAARTGPKRPLASRT